MKKLDSIQVLRAICAIFVFLSHSVRIIGYDFNYLGGFAVSIFLLFLGILVIKVFKKTNWKQMALIE